MPWPTYLSMSHTGTAHPFHMWTKFGDDMSKRSWVMLDKTDRLTDRQTDRQTNRQTNILAKMQILASNKLECGTWYHHPRRIQCVLSRNLRIFKVATWHYQCRHNLKNNCIWDNLQYCLLVPRSSNKPVMLTIDLQSRKVLFTEIVFWHV